MQGIGSDVIQPQFAALSPGAWSLPQESQDRGGGLIAVMIWAPALFVAGIVAWAGMPVPALIIAGFAMAVHCLFRPHVAVYALIATLPVDWMVTVIPHVSTLAKLLGIFALFVSIPKVVSVAVPTQWGRTGKWMVLLILYAGLSIFRTSQPLSGMLYWQSIVLRWGVAVLVFVHFTNWNRFRIGVSIYLAFSVVSSLVCIARGDFQSTVDSSYIRQDTSSLVGQSADLAVNPNVLARLLGLAVLVCLTLLLVNRSAWRRVYYIGSVVVLALAILLLKGRAVWIGLPFAVVTTMILLGGAAVKRRLVMLAAFGVMGMICGFVMIKLGFVGEGVVHRFNSIFEEGVHAGNRWEFWMAHARAFVHSGFIGVGLSQMRFSSETMQHIAHNDWFSIAGELGIPGLICFAMFHVTLYARIRAMQNVWWKMFCHMTLLFMMFCGLSSDDYVSKFYALSTGLMCCCFRFENGLRGHQAGLASWDDGVAVDASAPIDYRSCVIG